MDLANWITFGVLLIGAVAGLWTSAVYGYRVRWWKRGTDEYRRHIGVFTASLTAVFWLYLARPFIDPDVFAWIRTPAFALVVACVVWRLVIMLRRPKHQEE
jgi:hypothetical protein